MCVCKWKWKCEDCRSLSEGGAWGPEPAFKTFLRQPHVEKEWPGRTLYIGSFWLLPIPTGSNTNSAHKSCFWTMFAIMFQLNLSPEYFHSWVHAWVKLMMEEKSISRPRQSHSDWFPLLLLTCNTFPKCPHILLIWGANSGKLAAWARTLTSRVKELQTSCWLKRPPGRQHVWHQATSPHLVETKRKAGVLMMFVFPFFEASWALFHEWATGIDSKNTEFAIMTFASSVSSLKAESQWLKVGGFTEKDKHMQLW